MFSAKRKSHINLHNFPPKKEKNKTKTFANKENTGPICQIKKVVIRLYN